MNYPLIYSILTITTTLLLAPQAAPEAVAQATTVVHARQAVADLSETEKINRLISFVGNLQGATFIRNGSEHTPKEAAAHLQSKFNKHHAKIKSANAFIDLLATKSSVTGEIYKIRFADGSTTESYKVLQQELERIEKLK